MQTLIETLAMALDTLPAEGRVLLLSVLLSVALYGFTRAAAGTGLTVNLMYRKGALVALLLVPSLVYLTDVQMPVHVQEVVAFQTPVPAYVSVVVLSLWCLGCIVCGVQLLRSLQRERRAAVAAAAAPGKISARAAHWVRRLSVGQAVVVRCAGAEQPWHVAGPGDQVTVVLPAAACNWPVGVVDVMLLQQLAQLKQHAWAWLFFARLVQVLYWPLPWVARLVEQLAALLVLPAGSLAEAAYRDREGWRRDVRHYDNRQDTLTTVVWHPQRLRLPGAAISLAEPGAADAEPAAHTTDESFEQRWAGTKARLRRKYQDPHEQAYWMIAVACVLVAVASTLTIVKAPPEFPEEFLEDKWRDSMVRRIPDFREEHAKQRGEGGTQTAPAQQPAADGDRGSAG